MPRTKFLKHSSAICVKCTGRRDLRTAWFQGRMDILRDHWRSHPSGSLSESSARQYMLVHSVMAIAVVWVESGQILLSEYAVDNSIKQLARRPARADSDGSRRPDCNRGIRAHPAPRRDPTCSCFLTVILGDPPQARRAQNPGGRAGISSTCKGGRPGAGEFPRGGLRCGAGAMSC